MTGDILLTSPPAGFVLKRDLSRDGGTYQTGAKMVLLALAPGEDGPEAFIRPKHHTAADAFWVHVADIV